MFIIYRWNIIQTYRRKICTDIGERRDNYVLDEERDTWRVGKVKRGIN